MKQKNKKDYKIVVLSVAEKEGFDPVCGYLHIPLALQPCYLQTTAPSHTDDKHVTGFLETYFTRFSFLQWWFQYLNGVYVHFVLFNFYSTIYPFSLRYSEGEIPSDFLKVSQK